MISTSPILMLKNYGLRNPKTGTRLIKQAESLEFPTQFHEGDGFFDSETEILPFFIFHKKSSGVKVGRVAFLKSLLILVTMASTPDRFPASCRTASSKSSNSICSAEFNTFLSIGAISKSDKSFLISWISFSFPIAFMERYWIVVIVVAHRNPVILPISTHESNCAELNLVYS